MIAVIDYGMGNLRSVEKALQVVGAKTKVTSRAADLKRASHIVLPGVGSFGDAMRELRKRKLITPIKDAIASGKPFLGLCLGLQLLFEKSEEAPGVKGLNVLKGDVRRFKFTHNALRITHNELKVPHMGWNNVAYSLRLTAYSSKILTGVENNAYMYFVHSYYVRPKDESVILTTTDYGIRFASGIAKDNIYGLQFHPEKSQAAGLRILRNFVCK